jgi:hypothetical protein
VQYRLLLFADAQLIARSAERKQRRSELFIEFSHAFSLQVTARAAVQRDEEP